MLGTLLLHSANFSFSNSYNTFVCRRLAVSCYQVQVYEKQALGCMLKKPELFKKEFGTRALLVEWLLHCARFTVWSRNVG